MKSFNSAAALLIAAALIAGGTGCKHAPPKPPTPIPNLPPREVSTGPEIAVPQKPTTGPVNPGNRLQGAGNDQTPTGGKLPGSGELDGRNVANPGGETKANTLPPLTEDQKNAVGPRDMNANDNRIILAEDTVYFDFDRNTVKPSELPKVQRVAAYLKNNANVNLRIEGNCDERGTDEYNRSLGERRALAIRELLVAEGVAPTRITTLSYGEDKPADPGHDETAWSKNRRGDFVVLEPKSLQ